MITEIGISAGDIWQVLDKKSPSSLKDLLQSIDAPRDRVLMGLGWLAREGHVNLLLDKDSEYLVALNKDFKA